MALKSGNNGLSNHILPTSANLLGICFLIFTIARTADKSDATLLDELAGVGVGIFLLASICSYISLRTNRENRFETFADIFFFTGLLLLAVTAILMIFKFIV